MNQERRTTTDNPPKDTSEEPEIPEMEDLDKTDEKIEPSAETSPFEKATMPTVNVTLPMRRTPLIRSIPALNLVTKPVYDPTRTAQDVIKEMAPRDSSNKQFNAFQRQIQMSRQRQSVALQRHKMQNAQMFLTQFLYPYIDGFAEVYNVKDTVVLNQWINDGKTFAFILDQGAAQVEAFLNNPGITLFKPYIAEAVRSMNEEQIRGQSVTIWWLEQIKITRPAMARVIEGNPHGMSWLGQTLIEIFTYLRGKV